MKFLLLNSGGILFFWRSNLWGGKKKKKKSALLLEVLSLPEVTKFCLFVTQVIAVKRCELYVYSSTSDHSEKNWDRKTIWENEIKWFLSKYFLCWGLTAGTGYLYYLSGNCTHDLQLSEPCSEVVLHSLFLWYMTLSL